MKALSAMIAHAIQSAIGTAVGLAKEVNAASSQPKVPSFSHEPYQRTEGMTVADYFDRLEWALQLNNIPKQKYADYARVHMGSELNTAFKFLITPKSPEEVPYSELRLILQQHFDEAKNKFVESIKFRNIRQQKGETIAQFVLRLKQGAALCEYGSFAYTHLPIDEEFRHVLTLNTSTHGLIRPRRAVYGAANIPAIWQRRMEAILQDSTNKVSFFR
ncbi:uncharacterized protein LOC118507503 [Anopheles stephensi]|uniref:uncharacterized protein LOC118507503 n=1 Tax=Anopheles stephensi TaxID=30069 RepID=UPI00165892A0|nr:uncharacterized protein LOC118507503 [Anopheles stephensi]